MSATISFHGPYTYRASHHPPGTVKNHPAEYGSLTISDPQGNDVDLYFLSREQAQGLTAAAAGIFPEDTNGGEGGGQS
jgi:hypothetical protein